VAEDVPEILSILSFETNDSVFSKYKEQCIEIVNYAKKCHKEFLTSGKINENLLKACLLLAQTDVIFRSKRLPFNYGQIDRNDVYDLDILQKIIPVDKFKAEKYIILNPTFGEGSKLVGGADADIIMDGVLIDIKTSKYLEFKREYFDQLIGYYVLTKIGGIDDFKGTSEINELAVYFSRYAKLVKIKVKEVIDESKLPDFIDWFKARAKREFG